jgi:hypothetical protein
MNESRHEREIRDPAPLGIEHSTVGPATGEEEGSGEQGVGVRLAAHPIGRNRSCVGAEDQARRRESNLTRMPLG